MAEPININDQIKISFKDGSSIVAQVTEQNDSELTCKALSKNEVYNEGDTVFVDTVTDKIEKISLKKKSSSIADEALGYGFEDDYSPNEDSPECPHCEDDLVRMDWNEDTQSWECPECGYAESKYDVQERYSMKKKSSLSRDEWENVNDVAYDVAKNYQEITGTDPLDTIDPEGSFNQDVIDADYPKIEEYVKSNYNLNNREWEEFLYKVDDELLDMYGEEGYNRNKKEDIVEEDDYLDDEVTGLKKQSKRFQYKFDKHKSPWIWNKESELLEKDEEAIQKAAMKKQSSKLNYQVLLYSETDFGDTLIQEAKKFNGKYIGHGVGFGDYDIQFEFRNEDNMNRFVNQMKNANFINGIDIQVYDGDNFIENRTVKGIKKQSNIDNKLSGLFDSPDDTFTVRIYSNQRDYENGESEREMQNFDNEDEAYEWIRSFDNPYYYEITVIPKEGQGYVWETGECEPY